MQKTERTERQDVYMRITAQIVAGHQFELHARWKNLRYHESELK